MNANLRSGYCIYIHTLCQGPVPVVSDGEGKYAVFETELAAQQEVADYAMTRIQQFLDGERDFDDAMTVEEFIVQVTVHPDGIITDEDGRCFNPNVEWAGAGRGDVHPQARFPVEER